MSFQKLILCGEVVSEPELRYTQSGIPCCAFRLKTVESWPGADGTMREEAEIHKVIVWREQAERVARELKKGQTALVEGKNKTRKWMSENNHEIDITEVVAIPNGVRFLAGGPGPAARAAPPSPTPTKNPEPKASGPEPQSPPKEPKKPMKAAAIKPLPGKDEKPLKVAVDVLEPQVADDLPF
jgi:single-strand DNA-binding protein